jgi:ComF family protein
LIETQRLRRVVSSFFEAAEALIFPWDCTICGARAAGGPVCADCRDEVVGALESEAACPRCALSIGRFARRDGGCSRCRGRRLGFAAAIALGPDQRPIRHLCLLLKSERHAWMARWLVDALIEARDEVRRLPGDAWVVPVPLHWRRHWKRGYNQADELALRLARRLALRRVRVLRRVVDADPLAGLGRTERARVMRDAFRVRASARTGLSGRTVVLVDDIMTTGATSGSAARTLKKAGAARVVVVVIGRTEGKT